jgi:AP-3 complex subunit delta-1
MAKITPTHPQMVAEYQEEIMQSLDDSDVSIRMRALELVTSMVSCSRHKSEYRAEQQVDRDSLQAIVDQLLAHLAPSESKTLEMPSAAASLAAASGASPTEESNTAKQLSLTPAYRLALTLRLLAIISNDTYVNVSDFEWVISVLIDVAYVSNVDVGTEVKTMLLDIVGRVKSIREYAVRMLEKVIGVDDLRERAAQGTGEDGLLEAAVWICGEYARSVDASSLIDS